MHAMRLSNEADGVNFHVQDEGVTERRRCFKMAPDRAVIDPSASHSGSTAAAAATTLRRVVSSRLTHPRQLPSRPSAFTANE